MPAYGTYDLPASSAEYPAIQPAVTIGGSTYEYVTCLAIEKNTGIVPSKALIKLAANVDVSGNMSLNAYQWNDIRPWARVRIDNGLETLFLGQLIKRRDQGRKNSIIWEVWDDR